MKKQIRAKRVARKPVQQAGGRKLWLASLGAVSIARKQGERLVSTLIEEGTQVRSRAESLVETTARDARRAVEKTRKQVVALVQPIAQRAKKTVKRYETRVGKTVGAALGRMGVPSKRDIQELIGQVDQVKRKVATSARKRAA